MTTSQFNLVLQGALLMFLVVLLDTRNVNLGFAAGAGTFILVGVYFYFSNKRKSKANPRRRDTLVR